MNEKRDTNIDIIRGVGIILMLVDIVECHLRISYICST